jgi:hypothetical protein
VLWDERDGRILLGDNTSDGAVMSQCIGSEILTGRLSTCKLNWYGRKILLARGIMEGSSSLNLSLLMSDIYGAP